MVREVVRFTIYRKFFGLYALEKQELETSKGCAECYINIEFTLLFEEW